MQVLFEPKFNIGDVVCLRIASDNKLVIDGFNIKQVTNAGEVSFFRYSMYDEKGENYLYSETDLQLVEAIEIR